MVTWCLGVLFWQCNGHPESHPIHTRITHLHTVSHPYHIPGCFGVASLVADAMPPKPVANTKNVEEYAGNKLATLLVEIREKIGAEGLVRCIEKCLQGRISESSVKFCETCCRAEQGRTSPWRSNRQSRAELHWRAEQSQAAGQSSRLPVVGPRQEECGEAKAWAEKQNSLQGHCRQGSYLFAWEHNSDQQAHEVQGTSPACLQPQRLSKQVVGA